MGNMRCQNCNIRGPKLFYKKAYDYPKNCNKIKEGDILVCAYCKEQFEESENILKRIIDSRSEFRLVIGGPGTGKTYLFKSLIEDLPEGSKVLVITFINNLVEGLNEQLSQIVGRDVSVRTLHSFCKGFLLGGVHGYEYFPELPKIVERDAAFLEVAFSKGGLSHEIANIEREGSNLRFFLSRAEYYDAVSHNDAVYRVYLYLKEHLEKIPKYAFVIIDEYQDFNSIEANIIGLLAKNNKIVISGDDDQALYRFKSASPEFIRDLYKNADTDKHFLVYCRRCTAALVKATDAFINKAEKCNLLKNRIPKNFKCYWPDKFDDSRNNPKIILGKCSTDLVAAKYIKKRILEIVDRERIQPRSDLEPEFLIIGPSKISHYLRDVHKVLTDANDINPDIYEIEYKKERETITVNDGYELVKENPTSNLGWRIILYCDHPDADKEKEIIHESLNGKTIAELLPAEYRKKHMDIAKSTSGEDGKKPSEGVTKKIRIRLTSYLGAKGLSANHVFVLGLINGILPENPYKVSDDEVCQFIVLLTRARRSLSLIVCKSFDRKKKISKENLSTFVSMIPRQLLEIIDNIRASDVR